MSDADDLWRALETNPVDVYTALGAQLEEVGALPQDPRIAEWELAQYDAAVDAICAQNPDIVADELHPYVAAAGGDFDVAVQMYRDAVGQVLANYGVDPASPDEPSYRALAATPQDALHRAIEEATRAATGGSR